jgi:hypothetical protein
MPMHACMHIDALTRVLIFIYLLLLSLAPFSHRICVVWGSGPGWRNSYPPHVTAVDRYRACDSNERSWMHFAA